MCRQPRRDQARLLHLVSQQLSEEANSDIATALARSRALLSGTRQLVKLMDPRVKLERWIGSVKDLCR